MDQKAIIKICKDLGCCDACCLRYLGLKNPTAFENSHEFVQKILDAEVNHPIKDSEEVLNKNTEAEENEVDSVPAKKTKTEDVCVSCLGILQEETWPECLDMVQEAIDSKGYECETFACALSAPIATILREKAVTLQLAGALAQYDEECVTPLKEAWKWSAGAALARRAGKTLHSGAVAPLLVTVALRYAADADEARLLGAGAGAGGGTRRGAAAAAAGATRGALAAAGWAGGAAPAPAGRALAAGVSCEHAPLYLGGRYVKLSRALPQTPWVLRGERVLPSSVQEIIFEPLARLLGLDPGEAERRLKFMSAGREDVDVRCLGTGRPFAVEVADPRRAPTPAELSRACDEISSSGAVIVRSMVPVTREQLAELKRGEESKCKTYEALCIKLAHTAEDIAEGAGAETAVRVTARDVENVRAAWGGGGGGEVEQRTPLRVLHRRPLLARRRALRLEAAAAVRGAAALLAVRVRTDAGTYVKEWAHGDLRRTRPSLRHALRAPADILALDVAQVHLDWP